jgi:hypothetical protein
MNQSSKRDRRLNTDVTRAYIAKTKGTMLSIGLETRTIVYSVKTSAGPTDGREPVGAPGGLSSYFPLTTGRLSELLSSR